ncbi:Uncharacterised ACR, COG2135 [Corynebacterium renale]|nr:Uncharacterised ACR, COG2135 [Corynebacterium renale]STC94555.1 Uncharacterised ACR, COG2135 [Corynebacterium renale]
MIVGIMVHMCGRYVLFADEPTMTATLEQYLGPHTSVEYPYSMPGARYNIAPTTIVPVVQAGGEDRAVVHPARWGLLPHWKKDMEGPPLFNARAETVAEKPSFRSAFSARPALIPLDGYYEWKDKQPWFVRRIDGVPLLAAGLWDTGADTTSATMITTVSTGDLEWLHHRMPRFLAPDEARAWLYGSAADRAALLEPMGSALIDAMTWGRADQRVGSVANDDADLLPQECVDR